MTHRGRAGFDKKAYNKAYYKKHRRHILERQKKYDLATIGTGRRDISGRRSEIRRREFIARVKALFGGLCKCCGEGNLEFLTLDHVKGDGGGMFREAHYYTYREAFLLFEQAIPINRIEERFRLLCWNCNTSCHKGDGTCVHTGRQRPVHVSAWAIRMRERLLTALKALGDLCACCGESQQEFLTIDHVDEDGRAEPKTSLGQRNHLVYYKKIQRAFDGGDFHGMVELRKKFQILCANCNNSKHYGVSKDYGKGVCAHHRRDLVKAGPMTHPEWPYATPMATGTCG